jgi:hypothetical protein
MKIKRALYLAIIVGLLASMGAIPALAEDGDIPMWVQRARLTYTGRSSGGPDEMVAYIHIRDAELNMVEGATVEATWRMLDDEPASLVETAVTNEQGIAIFTNWSGAGDYEICVTGVDKEGWVWTGEEVCAVYWLPPYPYPYPFAPSLQQ